MLPKSLGRWGVGALGLAVVGVLLVGVSNEGVAQTGTTTIDLATTTTIDPAVTTTTVGGATTTTTIGTTSTSSTSTTVAASTTSSSTTSSSTTSTTIPYVPVSPTAAYGQQVAASGPLLYWPLNETTGTVAADASGQGRPGTFGGVSLGQPALAGFGTAISGSVSRAAVAPASGPVTLEFWSKGDGGLGGNGWLIRLGHLGLYRSRERLGYWNQETLLLYASPTAATRVEQVVNDSPDGVYRSFAYGSTTWRHYVITHDGTKAVLYVDGIETLSVVGAWDRLDNMFVLGEQPGRTYDEAAVYPKVLSQAEITGHYSRGLGSSVCQTGSTGAYQAQVGAAGAVGAWAFDGPGDRVAWDRINCWNGGFREAFVSGASSIAGGGTSVASSPAGMVAPLRGAVPPPTAWAGVTLEFWSKGDNSFGGTGWLARLGTFGLQRGFDRLGYWNQQTLRLTSSGAVARVEVVYDDGPDSVARQVNYASDQWRHYVITHDGTKAVLYVDGEESLTLVAPWDRGDEAIEVGAAAGRSYDEVAVYKTVLSKAEIVKHWSMGVAGQACKTGVSTAGTSAKFLLNSTSRLVWDEVGCRNGAHRNVPTLVPGSPVLNDSGVTTGGMAAYVGDLIPPSGAFTVDFWSKANNGLGNYGSLIRMGSMGMYRTRQRVGYYTQEVLRLDLAPGVGSTFEYVTSEYAENGFSRRIDYGSADWKHWALVYDGTNLLVYFDGVLVPNFVFTGTWERGNGVVVIGESGDRSSQNLRVTGRALTAAEIAAVAVPPITRPVDSAYGVSLSMMRGIITPDIVQTVVDPVNTATGAMSHVVTDLTAVSRGESFELERSYDSVAAGVTGPFGPGWGWNLGESIVSTPTDATWNSGAGAKLVFPSTGSGYRSPAGVIAELRAVAGGGWELASHEQVVSSFDATGRLVSRKDRSGQGLTFAYLATGKLATVTDASGQVVTFTYGTSGVSLGRLIKAQAADGRNVRYTYTANIAGATRLTSVIDLRNKITTLTYTATGLLASEVDPLGQAQFTNTYDTTGRVLTQADPTGALSSFVWNDTTGEMTMTDATLAVTKHRYNSYSYAGAQTPSGTTTVERNANLYPTKYTDTLGKVWLATYDARGNMLSRTSPLGFVESWSFDALNNPISHSDARGAVTTYTYDPAGRLVSEARPLGVNLGWSWNPDGTLASSTDPRGGVTSFTYDANGNMLSSITPLGLKTTYAYDIAGRVLTVTEPRGNVVGAVAANFQQRFTYDADGNVLTEKDALGRTTTNVFDNAGRKSKSTAPDGGVTLYGYNAANELINQTNPDGGVVLFEYDNRGLRTKETSPIGAVTTFAYDPSGRLVLRVDPRGNVAGGNPAAFSTTFTYDGENRMLTSTDPIGRVTSYTYDVQGRRLSEARPDGTTSSVFDPNGNVTLTTTESGTSSTVFDALNRVVSSTDVRGKTSTLEYDLASNVVASVDPLGRRSTSVFDADGRVTVVVDPRGNVAGGVPTDFDTLMSYDEAGNVLTVTDPLGLVTTTTYDRVGNRASVKNPRLQTTSFVYSPVNQVTRVTAPVVGATNYVYSTSGNLLTRTDPLLRVTNWQYDVGNRMTRVTDPAGRFATYTYDVAGNRTQIVDAVANLAANPALGTTDVVFDSLNRPVSTTYSDGAPTVSYSYDGQGRRSQMVDGSGTTVYGFDAADRVASVTRGADVFAYAYDPAGNVTSRTYPDGTVVAGTFDDAGQQVTTTEPAGTVSFAYDVAGNPITSTYPNGVTRTTSFDNASRVTTVNNSSGVVVLSRFTYTRDANGNPTGVDYTNGTGLVPVESQRLTYDNTDRLTKVCQTATTCATANQTVWSYDKNGNRLTEKVGAAAQSVYTYDTSDQLSAISGAGAKSFSYNANGDQITAGADTATFNTARQTTGATVGGVATTFAYDGNGNRHTITSAGVATAELWDTMGGLPNLAIERSAAGVVQRRYTYGRGTETLGYNDPTATTQGWYMTDALGSVANITNSAGVSVATYTYNPFGTQRLNTTTPGYASNPLKYTGQHLDPTGNYNLRARQYNPTHGRFTQVDPLAADTDGAYPSAYLYGNNNPALLVDPSGMRVGVKRRVNLKGYDGPPVRPTPVAPSQSPTPVQPAPGEGPGIVNMFVPPERHPDNILDSEEWIEGQKSPTEKGVKKLNGKRVLFRRGKNTGRNFTPRPGKDTDNYPLNGLSTYTYPHECDGICQVLDVDKLIEVSSIVQMRADPRNPFHIFLQAVEKSFHLDWSTSRVDEETARGDSRTRAVRSARIGFWQQKLSYN